MLAVDERQALETLTRDEKTANRALTQVREKHDTLRQRKEKLTEDGRAENERRSEVRCSRATVDQSDFL